MKESAHAKFSLGLSEVALGVEDVAASAYFYREVVGLVPELIEEKSALFWAGEPGRQQRVILLSRSLTPISERTGEASARVPDAPSVGLASLGPGDFGLTHFALEVARNRLEDAVAHVRDQGLEVYGPVRFDRMEAVTYYFQDPDGNLVEFWSPSPDSLKEPPLVVADSSSTARGVDS